MANSPQATPDPVTRLQCCRRTSRVRVPISHGWLNILQPQASNSRLIVGAIELRGGRRQLSASKPTNLYSAWRQMTSHPRNHCVHEMTEIAMVAAASQNSSAFIDQHPRPARTSDSSIYLRPSIRRQYKPTSYPPPFPVNMAPRQANRNTQKARRQDLVRNNESEQAIHTLCVF